MAVWSAMKDGLRPNFADNIFPILVLTKRGEKLTPRAAQLSVDFAQKTLRNQLIPTRPLTQMHLLIPTHQLTQMHQLTLTRQNRRWIQLMVRIAQPCVLLTGLEITTAIVPLKRTSWRPLTAEAAPISTMKMAPSMAATARPLTALMAQATPSTQPTPLTQPTPMHQLTPMHLQTPTHQLVTAQSCARRAGLEMVTVMTAYYMRLTALLATTSETPTACSMAAIARPLIPTHQPTPMHLQTPTHQPTPTHPPTPTHQLIVAAQKYARRAGLEMVTVMMAYYMRLTALLATTSETPTACSMAAIARPWIPTHQPTQMHPLTLPTIAKISQLLKQKPLLLDLRDVSLHLKAGLPMNFAGCTWLTPVLT